MPGWALDTVKTDDGSVLGQVTAISPLEVKITQGNSTKTVAVNQIEVISYDTEPAMLKTARAAIEAGRYEDAVATLEKLDPAKITRAEIVGDIEFYRALAVARLALASGEKVKQAGTLMNDFRKKNSGSYHYLKASEIVGDLLVADGQFATAEQFYDDLAKAPWPEYKLHAAVAIGEARLAGGKPAEALTSFEAALAIDAKGTAAENDRMAATLGKARCLAESGKADEAIAMVQAVIDHADPEDVAHQANAYNALGIAYRKAGQPKDALLAFLHVDVLYFSARRQHIEALENLNQLWMEVHQPQQAADAARTLRDRYNVSPRNP